MVQKMLIHIHMTMDFCANSESRMYSSDNSHDRLGSGEALSVLFRNAIPITGVIFRKPTDQASVSEVAECMEKLPRISGIHAKTLFPEPHSSYSNLHIKTEGERNEFFCLFV